MSDSSHLSIRPNPRRKTIGLMIWISSSLILVVMYFTGIAFADHRMIDIVLCLAQFIGLLLFWAGSEVSLSDDRIRIGLTNIKNESVRRVHQEPSGLLIHWQGPMGNPRTYRLGKRFFHPDDWLLLQNRLLDLGSPKRGTSTDSPQLAES